MSEVDGAPWVVAVLRVLPYNRMGRSGLRRRSWLQGAGSPGSILCCRCPQAGGFVEYCSPDRNGDTALSLPDEGTTRSLEDRMAIFDRRGQQVNYQYNAAGDIRFDSVQHAEQLLQELGKLRQELDGAIEAGALGRTTAM